VRVDFAPGALFVIGRKELIVNKRASGREKDLRDVAILEAMASLPARSPARQRRRRR
jgi:hypothetical protein